ncbi:uncharacterized protein LOC117325051 [Pecten maximus]|uniref:uncharacterized protein LOC117325051 n=1 Tax=Pecten maximus TaxID=6579 RepID=UPI001457F249|nr:uncharacterized protein LOC117325051 [Pecten maximus]
MLSLQQRFAELEPSYRDCYDLYHDTLTAISDQHGNFNTITLTMLKNQINDQSVNTIKEALQKRMLDLKSVDMQCRPGSEGGPRDRSTNSTGVEIDANLSDTHTSIDSTFDFSSDVTASFDSAITRHSQMSLPSASRTLRILIAGDVNAGKTSVLNLFLGDEYLPAYCGKCTTVPCEVHNSKHRFVRIYYNGSAQHDDIELPFDKNDPKWKDIGRTVHFGTYKEKSVRRLLLFWPLRFFDDPVSSDEFGPESGLGSLRDSVRDPDETTPKVIADDDPHQTHVKQIAGAGNTGVLPIVFLDLPGISDNESEVSRILENIPDFHLFIFVIDIGGEPIRKTFEKMLENVKKKITLHGIEFNPESALFLLNRSDMFQPGPYAEPIEKTILSAIKPNWPMASACQLHRLSCAKIRSGEESIEPFREKIWNFLEAANRQNLEEHFLWLINLLDTINRLFDKDENWLPCLENIKMCAKEDNAFLDKELDMIETRKSFFCKKIVDEAKTCEGKLRNYITEQPCYNTADFNTKLKDVMKTDDVQSLITNFNLTVKTLLETHRKRLKGNVRLVEYLEKQGEKSLGMNDVLNSIATLVSIPFASVVLLGRSLREELEIAFSDPKDRQISRQTHYFVMLAEAAIQQEINFIVSQRNIRQEILSFVILQNRDNDQLTLRHFDEKLKRLWEIYTRKVLTHNFSYDDVKNVVPDKVGSTHVDIVRIRRGSDAHFLARKCLKSKVKHIESTHTCTLQNVNIYRELVIMRSLTRKDSENCVKYSGSASWMEGDEQILAILMGKSDSSLEDLVKNLQQELISLKRRLQLAVGAAKGLECLHQNGYIHRQVKPHHCLVYLGQNNEKDTVKICDFGHTQEEATPSSALDRRTVAYHAPELFKQRARHSTMSDVYSLGLVIWELWHWRKITCNPGEPPSIREMPSGPFKSIVKACLDVKPEKRPKCSEVVQTLNNFIGSSN